MLGIPYALPAPTLNFLTEAADELEAKDAIIAELVDMMTALRDILDQRESEGAFIDGGDLRFYVSIIDAALSKAKA